MNVEDENSIDKNLGSESKSLDSIDTAKQNSEIASNCSCQLRPAGSVSSVLSVCASNQNELRSKNYLVGSTAGGSGALLGSKELARVFPTHNVNIQVVTWNMKCPNPSKYPIDLNELFFPDSTSTVSSIYAICLQEIPQEKNELLIRLQAAIGPQHVLFSYAINGTLALAVFVSRELIWYTSIPQTSAVTTRTAVRTKGAVAICFLLFGTSILFLCSHFKASQDRVHLRVQDYNEIISSLNLPKIGFSRGYRSSTNLLNRFDAIFWAGDLNFRFDRSRSVVENVLRSQRPTCVYEDLASADQLLIVQTQGLAFATFSEGRIKFLPTYKFDVGSNAYDTSDKQRVPAYTDRILFKTRKRGDITCLHYDSIDSIRSSDHRPVYGVYSLALKPGCDSIALAAGLFHRGVYIAGNQRRALRFDLVRRSKPTAKSKVCTLQ